jgi:hypothetical protein
MNRFHEENRKKKEEFFVGRYVGNEIIDFHIGPGNRCTITTRKPDGRVYDITFYGYEGGPIGVTWKRQSVLV